MHISSKFITLTAFAFLLLPTVAIRATAADGADDKERVLSRLDVAAKNFHSASAEFQFDSVETDPVPDKDIQKGRVYYDRNGSSFQMAAHILQQNGKPAPKDYSYNQGAFKLFEPGLNQVTTFTRANRFEKYVMLGFGASGKELAAQWDITYQGSEVLDGVKTEKLDLVAKDPEVRKNIKHITIWVDPDRAISLKQIFYEDQSHYRVSVYFNIKVNQPLSKDAFVFKTDKKTQYITR